MNDHTKPGKIIDGVCFSTEHVYQKDGVDIPYTCNAQEFLFVDELDQPEASFFLYTYVRKDVESQIQRPVIFSYGGGPGDAANPLSLWGPKFIDPKFTAAVGPYPELVDNPYWLIDAADIVCMDPPGAGYGHIYQYDKREKYWGVQPDAVAFIDMMKHWLTKYGRWCSPKYIAGTSYGGLRTAILSDLLCGGPYYVDQRQYTHGIALNGAIFSATTLDLDLSSTNLESAGVEASMAKTLPTYAAVNWYWNRDGKPELKEFLAETDRFIADEFMRAQWLGTSLGKEGIEQFTAKLSYYCGLPAQALQQYKNYEVPAEVFVQQFLADKDMRLSLYDGRQALPSSRHLGFYEDYADDPSNAAGTFKLAPLVRKYYREFLKMDVDREWIEVNFDANAQWTWKSNRSMIQHLDSAMRRNPQMYALIYGGLFDLAAAVGANRYALNHSGIDQSRVVVYESANSGHGTCGNLDTVCEYGTCVRKLIELSIQNP